ncbi:hypothetical protein FA13DRAFT_1514409 [Coprinellus micaceus]|uniref:F-box domain-containing protein n=1 Tax=Coprinellus micaceus TaxID=71717 RepID=A0A4Y7SMB4_COPMI|nr:hypothetical protein FA13DRAFT_1514409 [Coprinellus micaceus]
MEYLRFASLAHLHLDYYTRTILEEGLPVDSTFGLLRPLNYGSTSTLRSLTITRCNFASAKTLFDVFSALPPSVENIVLQAVHFDVGAFLELSEEAETKILPNLKGFEQQLFNYKFDLKSLLQYFKSRQSYSRHTGGIESPYQPDSLRYVSVSCIEAPSWRAACWQECSDIVQELRDDFGVTVRWVSC